jgi:exoribonuclease R
MNNIVGILECSSKYKYGFSKHNTPLYRFSPLNSELPALLVGSKIKDVTKNYLTLVDCENFHDKIPKGNISFILGECGEWEAEKLAVLWRFCPQIYKKNDKYSILNYTPESVLDLSSWETLNIDPEGCEDIDDCISYNEVGGNKFKIAITITNVASYIPINSEIDKKCLSIGQTFYFDKGNRTMLPKSYEEQLSLLPNRERYGVSLIFNVDKIENEFKLSNAFFIETKIINKRSYTYDNIYNSNHQNLLSFLKDFSKSEDSHKWIESLMIYYNTQAAELLKIYTHLNPIFRVNDKVTDDELHQLYQKYCPFLLFSSAKYTNYNSDNYHQGLNIQNYLHITSPIRRYADLHNQRVLLSILNSKNVLNSNNIELIENLNQRQKSVKKYERDLFLIKLLEKNRTGKIKGIIISKNKKYSIFIPEWKRIIKTVSSLKLSLEQEVDIIFYYNPSNKIWKERIIYEVI